MFCQVVLFYWKEKMDKNVGKNPKNCAPCHLPIEGEIYLQLAMVPTIYKCVICGKKKGATTMLLCDLCQQG